MPTTLINRYDNKEFFARRTYEDQNGQSLELTVENDTVTAIGGKSIGGSTLVQSDWKQSDTTAADYIKNKPNSYYGQMQAPVFQGLTCVGCLYDDSADEPMQSVGLWITRTSPTASIIAATWHYNDPLEPSKVFRTRTEIDYIDNGTFKKEIIMHSTSEDLITLTSSPTMIAAPTCSFDDIDKIRVYFVTANDTPKKLFYFEYLPTFDLSRSFEDTEREIIE